MKYFLKNLWALWFRLARALGRVNTVVLLTLFFYIIITPVALLRRLFGGDPLAKKPAPSTESYWVKREEKPFRKDDYLRQF